MLNDRRISMIADSYIDGEKVATFGAVLNLDNMELSMNGRYINKEACKEHRDAVRVDQADFENYAYMVQDKLKDT